MNTEAAPGLAVRPLRPERRMLSFAVSLMKSWGVYRDEYLRLTDFLCLKSQRFVSSPCPIHPKLEVSDEVIYFLPVCAYGQRVDGGGVDRGGLRVVR